MTRESERVEQLKQEVNEHKAILKVKEHDMQSRINFLEQENKNLNARINTLNRQMAALRADNELLEQTANRYVIKNESYRKALSKAQVKK